MENNNSLTLEVLGKEWLNFNRNSLKKSTLQTYKYMLEKHIFLSDLSDCSIKEISTDDLVNYTEKLLDNGLSPKTINGVLLTINSILKYAGKMYGVSVINIKYVKENKSEMRVLSAAEQNRLELYLRNNMDTYKMGILFALYTGVRIGELCALKWGDIKDGTVRINKTMYRLRGSDGKTSVIIGDPKTSSSNRTIPLPDFLNEIVEKRRGDDNAYCMANEHTARVEPRLLQKKFKTVTEHCSLEDVTFHTLRHTFATRCIECGFDAKTLSEILGHSDVKTTLNRYVHCSLELKKHSMNLLDKIAV